MSESQVSPSQTRVRDIMSSPVHTVNMDDTLLTVKNTFDRVRCHHVVVMEQKRIHGVVSDRDVLRVISPFVGNESMERQQDRNTTKRRVHQIMSREPVTVGPEETVVAAAETMFANHVSCMPVAADEGHLLGIVTTRDFVRWALRMSGAGDGSSGDGAYDEGVLVILDGARSYFPPQSIAELIRAAERSYEYQHGAGAARANRLPRPHAAGVLG